MALDDLQKTERQVISGGEAADRLGCDAAVPASSAQRETGQLTQLLDVNLPFSWRDGVVHPRRLRPDAAHPRIAQRAPLG